MTSMEILQRRMATLPPAAPQVNHAPEGRKQTALNFVLVPLHDDEYYAGFYDWLNDNWHVYLAFERLALKLHAAGRKHYGHREIWEVMRYESAIAEAGGEYKLNNNYTKSVAVLFGKLNSGCEGFFKFRNS